MVKLIWHTPMHLLRMLICLRVTMTKIQSLLTRHLSNMIATDAWNAQARCGKHESITITSHERRGVSNHQPHYCLLSNEFSLTTKAKSKPTLLIFCEGNPPVTGGFPSQKASDTENVYMSWHHPGLECNSHLWEATVYTMVYTHRFAVLCFDAVISSNHSETHESLTHILKGYCTGTESIVWLPIWQ